MRKDGSTYWGSLSAVCLDFGEEPCVLAITRDITDRKMAEERLRESEEKFRRIFESIEDVYYELSAEDPTVIEVSPSVELPASPLTILPIPFPILRLRDHTGRGRRPLSGRSGRLLQRPDEHRH